MAVRDTPEAPGAPPARRAPAVDLQREREFTIDELFFSTTDEKGIIRSGNGVFTRVAAYDEAEMIGKPHSLIRHPEMPRCVFKALWDTIEAGKPIAAYVKNRAKTGEPYWVMAIVVPFPGGYVSVRLKPSSEYLGIVKTVYPELRALELEHGGEREVERKPAMARSWARLLEILAGAGFPSYTSFMHQALAAELSSRAAHTEPPANATGAQRRALDHARTACLSITRRLDGLLGADLEGYAQLSELNRELSETSAFVLGLAESLRLFALNAILASSRLGGDGAVLHAVADIMRQSSDAMRGVIGEVSTDLERAGALLGEVGFRVSVAKLQSLMAIQFVDEMLVRRQPGPEHAQFRDPRTDDVQLLTGCLDDALRLLRATLSGLDTHLRSLTANAAHLRQDLRVMRALETNGRIEAARTEGAIALAQLFNEIHDQVELASTKVEDFAQISQLGATIVSRDAMDDLDESLVSIKRDTAGLAEPPRPDPARAPAPSVR